MVKAGTRGRGGGAFGFTLIELMVVMAIIATLISLAMPKYFHSAQKSREAVLRQDLAVMRDAIDKFYADRGRYPTNLTELAERRYLRTIPPDPVTDSATTWVVTPPPDATGADGVYDVHSGAAGSGLDGTPFEQW